MSLDGFDVDLVAVRPVNRSLGGLTVAGLVMLLGGAAIGDPTTAALGVLGLFGVIGYAVVQLYGAVSIRIGVRPWGLEIGVERFPWGTVAARLTKARGVAGKGNRLQLWARDRAWILNHADDATLQQVHDAIERGNRSRGAPVSKADRARMGKLSRTTER